MDIIIEHSSTQKFRLSTCPFLNNTLEPDIHKSGSNPQRAISRCESDYLTVAVDDGPHQLKYEW